MEKCSRSAIILPESMFGFNNKISVFNNKEGDQNLSLLISFHHCKLPILLFYFIDNLFYGIDIKQFLENETF